MAVILNFSPFAYSFTFKQLESTVVMNKVDLICYLLHLNPLNIFCDKKLSCLMAGLIAIFLLIFVLTQGS